MGRCNLQPAQYYDLTGPETAALLRGVDDRQLDNWRMVRRLAILLRNAHFTNPQDEMAYMPLPGDQEAVAANKEADMIESIYALAASFGSEVFIEDLP